MGAYQTELSPFFFPAEGRSGFVVPHARRSGEVGGLLIRLDCIDRFHEQVPLVHADVVTSRVYVWETLV